MTGTRSHWQRAAGPLPQDVDAVVVGAGITGASAVYWLTRLRPGLRVILLDRAGVAAGASGRNAGFLLRGTAQNPQDAADALGEDRARWIYRFTRESIEGMLQVVPAEACALSRSGALVAAGDAREAESLREAERLLRRWGEDVEYLTPTQVRERSGMRGFEGGLFDPVGASVDPVRLVRALVRASGAEFQAGHEVRSVEHVDGRFEVESNASVVRSPLLILALNAYLPEVLPEVGGLVRPVRAQMLSITPEREMRLPVPVYSHDGYYYVRSAPDGAILAGGARHLHEAEEVGYDDETTEGLQDDLERYVQRHLPAVGNYRVDNRWSGVMGFSPDSLPIVDRTPTGICWAGGYTGHGMAFGFGVGQLLALLALDAHRDEDQVEALRLFSATRFAQAGAPARHRVKTRATTP